MTLWNIITDPRGGSNKALPLRHRWIIVYDSFFIILFLMHVLKSMMAKLFPIKTSSTSRESDPIPGKYIINIAIALMCLRHNGLHFAEDIFKCNFVNENTWIPIKISFKFVSKGPINDIPVLVQIMAWRRPGNKPLSQAMMVNSPTHNASLGLND